MGDCLGAEAGLGEEDFLGWRQQLGEDDGPESAE
jgi:hypothetical protein